MQCDIRCNILNSEIVVTIQNEANKAAEGSSIRHDFNVGSHGVCVVLDAELPYLNLGGFIFVLREKTLVNQNRSVH